MTLKHEPGAHYSAGTILALGTFGCKTPAGRRYHNRCMAALAAMAIGTVAVAFLPPELRAWGWPVGGLGFSYISWEMWRYVTGIDELERRLQMEALAWTYLVAMAAAVALGSISLFLRWNINPVLLLFLEPLRAWRLYVIAKRYQ